MGFVDIVVFIDIDHFSHFSLINGIFWVIYIHLFEFGHFSLCNFLALLVLVHINF